MVLLIILALWHGHNPGHNEGFHDVANGFVMDATLFKATLVSDLRKFEKHFGYSKDHHGSVTTSLAGSLAFEYGIEGKKGCMVAGLEGSVKNSFETQFGITNSTKMFKQSLRYIHSEVDLPSNFSSTRREYLTEEAKKDIDNMTDIDDLFGKYGLYYANRHIFGGDYTLSYRTESKVIMSSSQFSTAVSASVKK